MKFYYYFRFHSLYKMNNDNIKICPYCDNVMIIQKDEILDTRYACILCKYQEVVVTTTTISTLKKRNKVQNVNPRLIHEVTSSLHQVTYRNCSETKCRSQIDKRKSRFRKVIYDNGSVKYYCLDCV